MFLVPLIRFVDQPFVKLRFANARLVRCNQKNCIPLWIESKCNAPYASVGSEAKLFHVRKL